jgi:hypothetical protein
MVMVMLFVWKVAAPTITPKLITKITAINKPNTLTFIEIPPFVDLTASFANP